MNSIAKSVSNAVKLRVKNGNGSSSSSTPPPTSVASGKTTTTKSSPPPQLPPKSQPPPQLPPKSQPPPQLPPKSQPPPPPSRKPMSTKSCLTTTKKDDDDGGNRKKVVINENETTANDQPRVRFHSSTNGEQSVDNGNGQVVEEEKVVVRMRNGHNNGRVQQQITNAIDNNAPIQKENDADEAMTAALLARKSYYTEEIATVKDLLDKDVKLTPAIMEILYFSFRSKINCCRTNEEKRDVCLDGLALLDRIRIDVVDANFLLHHEETLFYCYRGLSAALCDESSRESTWNAITSKYNDIFAIIDSGGQHELQPVNNPKRLEIVHRYSWLCYYYCDVAGSESVEFCEKQAKLAKEIVAVASGESDAAARLAAQRIGWIEQNIGNAKKRRRLSMALDISRFSQCLDI